MEDRTLIEAVTFAGVSEGLEIWVIDLELFICLLSVHLEDDHHEGTHEEARVRDLGVVSAGTVVIDSRSSLE